MTARAAGTLGSEGRSARKHRAILDAATTVFLRNGYMGASMDEVAALARVSKQTVYKHFADKERLFAEILLGTTEPVDEGLQEATAALADSGDVARDLGRLARQLLTALTRPEVVQRRRGFIGEAGRFPQLGRAWYERGFERGVATVAAGLERLAGRGLLRVQDPMLAASHFSGLVLWTPMNRVMFCGDDPPLSTAEIDRFADAAVAAFLTAYGQPDHR
jgi:TetR/AcrR family transcriptional repressor of mexJK operon